jgi:hypothetical protein
LIPDFFWEELGLDWFSIISVTCLGSDETGERLKNVGPPLFGGGCVKSVRTVRKRYEKRQDRKRDSSRSTNGWSPSAAAGGEAFRKKKKKDETRYSTMKEIPVDREPLFLQTRDEVLTGNFLILVLVTRTIR